MKMTEQRVGLLLMLAGLSQRAKGAPIEPHAVKVWLQEDALDGVIDIQTLWLFRAGYIASTDGKAYSITDTGWSALDEHLLEVDKAEQQMEEKFGKITDNDTFTPAKDQMPTISLLMGEHLLKAEAQRMTRQILPR